MRELVKPVLIGGAFIAAAVFLSGATGELFADGRKAVLVEETYVVKSGDTIWGIAETYCAKNTGSRRYILEYKSGMEENNPWLLERHGMIYPGDEIKVTYWVKGVR